MRLAGLGVFLGAFFAVLPAQAFRGDEGDLALQRQPAGARPAAQERPLAQLGAARLAEQSGVRAAWHSKQQSPLSVRGANLGLKQPFSGGKGLKVGGAGDYGKDAIAVLDNLSQLYQIQDASAEFVVLRVDADKQGFRHVRLQQRHRQLDVVGGELIVHFDSKKVAYQVNGRYVPGLSVDATPAITPEDAVRLAQQDLVRLGRPAGQPAKAAALAILAREVSPTLAYQVTLAYGNGPDSAGLWSYWIDAVRGDVLVRYSDVKRIAPPTDNGGLSSLTGSVLIGEGGAATNVLGWFENTGAFYMYNPTSRWIVANVSENTAYIDAMSYAFRPSSHWGTSDRAEMSTAVGFDTIQRYYREVHGRDSYDDFGALAQVNVHEGVNYVNAYWSPMEEMFYIGDGDGLEANSLAVLDVLAHEFTHAVTENTANLIYQNESGALNESFSDIFGTCVEFFGQSDDRASYPLRNPGKADWLCGEDCWLSSTALRDLKSPANAATVGAGNEQPSRYKGRYWYSGPGDNGGVHQNSGVQNFFFYLLCDGGMGNNDGTPYNIAGIGVKNAEQIAYRVLSYYCTPDTDYEAVAEYWVAAAQDINPDWAMTTRKAWDAVLGIPPPAMVSSSELPRGRVGTPYQYSIGALGGKAPYAWEIIDGGLPYDLSLTDGVIEGVPEEDGTFDFTLVLTDSRGLSATNAFSLTISPVFGAPFTETFESAGSMPDGWSQEMDDGLAWTFRNGSPQAHPLKAHGGAYNAFLGVETRTQRVTRLVSPRIDFGPNPHDARLTFWLNNEKWVSAQDVLRVYYKADYWDAWTLLATYSSSVSSWTQQTLTLPDPSQTYYVAFEGTAQYGYGVCVDDVQIWDPTPPLGIVDTSPLPFATKDVPYTLALTGQGGAAPYTFSLFSGALPSGFTMSGDGVITGTCDQVQTSEFIVEIMDDDGEVAYKTLELSVFLPRSDLFEEDFENGGRIPSGWTQDFVTNSVSWAFQSGGRYQAHPTAPASGNFNAFLWSGLWPVVDQKTKLISPAIDLGQAPAHIRLTFMHYMENWLDGQDQLRVFYRTSATAPWVLLATYSENTPVWTRRALTLPTPTSTYYIAFEGNAQLGYGVSIDDVHITDEAEAPIITTSMALPNGITGYPYSCALAASGGAEPYIWSVVSNSLPSGLSLSSDGVISGTPDTKGRVFFRVRVLNGDGSDKASTNLFSLRVTAPGPLPFHETFEHAGAMPSGWTQEMSSGNVSWTARAGSPASGGLPAAAYEGAYNACLFTSDSRSWKITRLVTPVLNLGVGTPNTRLTFKHCMASYNGAQDKLYVYYKTSLGAAWQLLATYESHTGVWTERTIDLPNPSPTYYIGFEGRAKYGCGVCIDDVLVTGDIASTYDTWKNANFSAEELADGLITGDYDDPDGDGVPNGLEYAMGLDPKTPDTEGLPGGGVEGGFLTYTYRENMEAADVTFEVEACTSLSLQDWTPVAVTEILREDRGTYWQVTVQHDTPVAGAPQRFMRLKVTLP